MAEQTKSSSINWGKGVSILLLLAFALILSLATVSAAEPMRAHPALLKLAQQRPNDKVRVIIQQKALDKMPAQAVEKAGGRKLKDLPLINGHVAELPLRAVQALSRSQGVRWVSFDAPVRSTAVSSWTVRDTFDTVSYKNDNGTTKWATNWVETGDDNTPSGGAITIKSDSLCPAGGYCLAFQANNQRSIARSVNLANASTAQLVFSFKFVASGGTVVLEVSSNDGASWTTLQTFSASVSTTSQFDLTPYKSATTKIRFRVSSPGGSWLYVDNLGIGYNTTTSDPYTPVDTFADEFASIAYNGSNGTKSWTSNTWTELGESDGVNAGKVRAVSSSKCYAGNCLRIGGQNVSIKDVGAKRKVDLSQAFRATLSFQYRRDVTYATSASVSVQVSSNGSTWTTLATYTFGGIDLATVSQSFDITAYKSATTYIRFIGSGTAGASSGYGYLYVDDVQITYTIPSAAVRATRVDQLKAETPALNGQGITVAVVDSGIANHTDLQSRIIGAVNYSSTSSGTDDENGHGTFVAGIIGGNGSLSNGARYGVAPNVNLLNVRVSNVLGGSYTSDVVDALQWIYNNRNNYNIKVVNLSLNSLVPESYHTSPLSAAVEILWFNKIVVVVSAGNNGTGSGPVTLLPPANDPFVITVGATDDKATASISDDVMNAFSAYGTTESGFAKPDLVAPGKSLVSPLASTSVYAWINYLLNRVDADYFRMSGTSASAAVVSGAAALLLQDEPTLNPDQVKYRLMATANKSWSGYNSAKAGAGYLDVYAAVKGTTTQTANTGIAASNLLFTGSNPAAWDSVDWGSVDWGSVDWGSVDWGSVDWGSVDWGSWRP
jgi:serine protease AprX